MLLRCSFSSFSAPSIQGLMRCSQLVNIKVLVEFDKRLRTAISRLINCDLSDEQWLQASIIPVWFGGHGIRRFVFDGSSCLSVNHPCTEFVGRSYNLCSILVSTRRRIAWCHARCQTIVLGSAWHHARLRIDAMLFNSEMESTIHGSLDTAQWRLAFRAADYNQWPPFG